MSVNAAYVLHFWFHEIDSKLWFSKDAEFDELVRTRFLEIHGQAMRGETYIWRRTPEGRLAEIILLDQFSRNMFRNRPESFATDTLALVLAQEAISVGADLKISNEKKAFMYMPFMHSESLVIHEEAVKLFSQPGLEFNLDYEMKHKVIIERFGRYPHRNAVLGRASSEEELEFLSQPGSGF
jgi:Uncharacterized protein conserved in bacteria